MTLRSDGFLGRQGPGAFHAVVPGGTGEQISVLLPGRVPYGAGLDLQSDLVVKRRAREIPDTLVLLEHDAVVTLGRGADRSHVLLDQARLAARGVELYETGRGGDVTIHSPGQIVGYPILALEGSRRDTHLYLRDLEEVMILAAKDFGVAAVRIPGLTGIWAGAEKLGAIGVRLNSGWITSHGFAFNVANDLSLFSLIVPCGIVGRGVTSLSRLLGRPIAVEEAMDRLASRFRDVFGSDSSASRNDPVGKSPELQLGSVLTSGERQPTRGARVRGIAIRGSAPQRGGEPATGLQGSAAPRVERISGDAEGNVSNSIQAERSAS